MTSVVALPPVDLLPPLTARTALTVWVFDPWVALILVVLGGFYLLGVRRLTTRGDRWPAGRTLAFVGGGLGSLVLATMSSLGAYDDTLFWVHTMQHLLLAMIAPVFLALGAPITLALRTLPPRPRGWLTAVLHSRAAKVIASPLVSFPLFVSVLPLLYFTGWYAATLRDPLLHELTHVHFVVVGCLFFWPLLGIDPIPGRIPHLARLFVLMLSLPVHIVVGLSLMMSDRLIAARYYRSLHLTWGPSPLSDQHLGGAILWWTADIVGLFYVAVLILQWIRADERDARRADRKLDRADRARSAGNPGVEDDLAAYNAYLARLHGLAAAPSAPTPTASDPIGPPFP